MDSRTPRVLKAGLAGGKGLSRCPRRTVLVLWPGFYLKACLCFGQCNPVCISACSLHFEPNPASHSLFPHALWLWGGARRVQGEPVPSQPWPAARRGLAPRAESSPGLPLSPETSHAEEGPGGPSADWKIRETTAWGLNYCCRENNKLITRICTYHRFLVLDFKKWERPQGLLPLPWGRQDFRGSPLFSLPLLPPLSPPLLRPASSPLYSTLPSTRTSRFCCPRGRWGRAEARIRWIPPTC